MYKPNCVKRCDQVDCGDVDGENYCANLNTNGEKPYEWHTFKPKDDRFYWRVSEAGPGQTGTIIYEFAEIWCYNKAFNSVSQDVFDPTGFTIPDEWIKNRPVIPLKRNFRGVFKKFEQNDYDGVVTPLQQSQSQLQSQSNQLQICMFLC